MNPATGTCSCSDGYFGNKCQLTCNTGYYGKDCQKQCTCRNGGTCNPVSFKPVVIHSNDICPKFALDIIKSSNNKQMHICKQHLSELGVKLLHLLFLILHATGSCECAPGFVGISCETPCRHGYYGNACHEQCPSSCHGQCNIVDGSCSCLVKTWLAFFNV